VPATPRNYRMGRIDKREEARAFGLVIKVISRRN